MFQFLLVRLKERAVGEGEKILLVSIPSGTIKRFEAYYACLKNKRFQFLLVRLKVATQNAEDLSQLGFNSFWYD